MNRLKVFFKGFPFVIRGYGRCCAFLKAYFPTLAAKVAYRVAYGKKCNLKDPKTFSEKLLWLSLNTYKNNPLILDLCDKYLVRDYISDMVGSGYLNEMYAVYDSLSDLRLDVLPNTFALKVSQGCATNLFCEDKNQFSSSLFEKTIMSWSKKQKLYDKAMANIGGISVKQLKKYYLCEKLLKEPGKTSPTDYKIYCFNGVPKAILVIEDRFGDKTGIFMTPEWTFLSELSKEYKKPVITHQKPESLEQMITVAKKLSADFPFVRVDMYDIDGKAIFGELTFFPNGCIHAQETLVDGKTMGELLDISQLIKIKVTN